MDEMLLKLAVELMLAGTGFGPVECAECPERFGVPFIAINAWQIQQFLFTHILVAMALAQEGGS